MLNPTFDPNLAGTMVPVRNPNSMLVSLQWRERLDADEWITEYSFDGLRWDELSSLRIFGEEANHMTNKPLPWPYTASDARDRAAEITVDTRKKLGTVKARLKCAEDREEVADAITMLTDVLRILESVGAPTRP